MKSSKHHQPWSKEEDATLEEMFLNNKQDSEIALALNRSAPGVESRRRYLKLIRQKPRSLRAKCTELFDQDFTLEEIAERVFATPESVRAALYTAGRFIQEDQDWFKLLKPWPHGLCYKCCVNEVNHRCRI